MRGLLGGLVLAVIVLSAIYVAIYPPYIAPKVRLLPFGGREVVLARYATSPKEYPGVKELSLSFKLKSGGVSLGVTEEPVIYEILVKGREGERVKPPAISAKALGSRLVVNVTAEKGTFEVLLGANYTHRCALEMCLGGFKASLPDGAKVEELKVVVRSAGGIDLEAEGRQALERANLAVGTGGIMMRLNGIEVTGNSSIEAHVSLGGISVEELSPASATAYRVVGSVGVGGLKAEHEGFKVLLLTNRELEMETPSYAGSKNRLDVTLRVDTGGLSIGKWGAPPFGVTIPREWLKA